MSDHHNISQDETLIDLSTHEEKALPGFTLESLVDQTLDDRYAVDQMIGMGAMGAVFRARQIRLRRTVALKVPKPRLCLEPDFLRRFEREALTMAKVVHQNIVQIFDVCVSPDHTEPSFIAMEHVEGTQLDRFLNTQRDTLTVSGILDLFRQIAQGMDAAHRHGIIHRDIKPANIFVTMPQRVPKIMDFGIARVEMEDAYQTTEEGGMIGTPAYMAPEQITGGDVSPSTDIYALGTVLYKILGGEGPWSFKLTHELLFAKVNTAPIPVTARNAGLPKQLDEVLSRALSLDPEQRHVTAEDLVEDVARALDPLTHLSYGDLSDTGVTQTAMRRISRSARRGERSLHPAGIALLAGVAGIVLAGLFIADPSDSRQDSAVDDLHMAQGESSLAGLDEEHSPPPPAETVPEPEPMSPEPAVVPEDTPIPSPTPSPTPTPTPAPTPEPSPAPPSPPPRTPTVDPELRWNPELRPPQISTFRSQSLMEELELWLAQSVRTPSFRRQFSPDRNALAKCGDEGSRELIRLLRRFNESYDQVSLYFEPRDESVVWENRALLSVDSAIKGKPRRHPDPNYRTSLWSSPAPLEVRLKKDAEGAWSLVSVTLPPRS